MLLLLFPEGCTEVVSLSGKDHAFPDIEAMCDCIKVQEATSSLQVGVCDRSLGIFLVMRCLTMCCGHLYCQATVTEAVHP